MMQVPFLPLMMSNVSLTEGASAEDAQNQNNTLMGYCQALAESSKWKAWVGDIEDEHMRRVTAYLLEAEDLYVKQLQAAMGVGGYQAVNESTLTSNIATYTNFAFPVIRGIVPNLIASDLVSVQPMTGPASVVFYMKLVAGSNKGTVTRGQELAEYEDENYSSENVDVEILGTGNGTLTAFTANIEYLPIRPNTFQVEVGNVVGSDDGNGNITGTGIAANSTVNYTTGAVTLNFSAAPADGDPINAEYRFDLEGSENVPEVDVIITSSPVIARPRKLRARYSLEGAANLQAIHGVSADTEVGNFMVQELRFEIDREIVGNVKRIAQAGSVSFDQTPTAGLGLDEHLRSFKKTLIDGGNLIFKATKRAAGNWVVNGITSSSILESIPGFQGNGMNGQHGVVNIGMLDGRWKCFKDSYISNDEFLIGHRGQNWMETGYILAFYIPLYATPSLTFDDFITRRGMGTLYGVKSVDGRYYATGTVT